MRRLKRSEQRIAASLHPCMLPILRKCLLLCFMNTVATRTLQYVEWSVVVLSECIAWFHRTGGRSLFSRFEPFELDVECFDSIGVRSITIKHVRSAWYCALAVDALPSLFLLLLFDPTPRQSLFVQFKAICTQIHGISGWLFVTSRVF